MYLPFQGLAGLINVDLLLDFCVASLTTHSILQCCGSGSVGFVFIFTGPDHSIIKEKGRIILISTVLCHLFNFLSLKTDVNVPSKSNMQKKTFVGCLSAADKKADSGSV